MKKNKIILSARADGFGERILAMLNAMFVSQVTDYKFGYIWYFDKKNYLGNKTILLSHDYLDEEEKIFNPEFRGKYSFKNKLKDNFGNNIIFSYGIFHKNRCYSFEKLKNGYYDEFEWGLTCSQYDFNYIFTDFNYGNYYEILKSCWKSIGFSNKIKNTIAKADMLSKEIGDYIALHIRSGDIVHSDRNIGYFAFGKAVSIHIAYDIILNKIDKNDKIIVFGDDIESLYVLKNSVSFFRDIILADELADCVDKIERSIFEIILMSNSQKIYASGKSGFSKLASIISNVNKLMPINLLYSFKEKKTAILTHMEKINISELQKAFSYLELYIAEKNSEHDNNLMLTYLQKAIQLDSQNYNYYILSIDCYLSLKKYDILNIYIKFILESLDFNIFRNVLFSINHYNVSYVYDSVFRKIFSEHIDIIQYGYIYIFMRVVGYKIKNDNNYKDIVDKFIEFDNIIANNNNNLTIENKMVGAVKIVENHLSYKIGKKIIHSKGLINILLLPFSIICIYFNHYLEKYIYNISIKYNPNSKRIKLEEYSDYDEAVRIQNYLSYKIGKIFVKNPFLFAIRLYFLKKERKNEKK
ncbi:TPA: hypothetical protein R8M50_000354 [Campylobacter jejuni]|nr:hypothetical protein [Campylobacter jejuni]HEF5974934.1 hypothetical protein [Campylobacter jejuni]HEF5984973.1 hypothetical protein [Campylobacter jejuni]